MQHFLQAPRLGSYLKTWKGSVQQIHIGHREYLFSGVMIITNKELLLEWAGKPVQTDLIVFELKMKWSLSGGFSE